MTNENADALGETIAALTRAELDINVSTLLDALWLAMQPNLVVPLGESAPAPDGREPPPPSGTTPPPPPPPTSISDGSTGTPPPVSQQREPPSRIATTSVYQGTDQLGGEFVKASPIRIPAGAALPGKLAIARAMRPFKERWRSRRSEDIDEEATAEATAEQGGRVMPVFCPRPERWYDAALVVEDAPSMDVWHATLAEFRQLLVESGAFRDVRTWRLGFAPSSSGGGALEPVLHSSSGGRASPGGLASTRVRRLIFFATHGISPRWSDASLANVLDEWARSASVVILHVLPPHLWARTTLGEPRGLVHTLEAGARTARLALERFAWDLSLDEDEPVTAIPVIPLDAATSSNWAQMQMARGRRAAAMLIPMRAGSAPAAIDETDDDDRLVALFHTYASPLAFRLAVYLAPGPFTLPVARLIQAAKFGPEAQQSQLAEVLLSGLVRRVTTLEATVHPDWVQYEIHQRAREILLRSLREEDAHAIVETLQQHVGRFIEQTYGKPVDFRALVRDEHGEFDLPAWAQPFANIGSAIINMQTAEVAPTSGVDGAPEQHEAETLPMDPAALRAALDVHFGKDRVTTHMGRDQNELPHLDIDEQRNYLLMAAVELLDKEQRKRLFVLGVTERIPLPSALWRRLVSQRDIPPLDTLGGITIGGDGSLNVEDEVHNTLFRHMLPEERVVEHRRVVDAYRSFPAWDMPDDGYHYQHYLIHAARAETNDAAESVLFDETWLTRKVQISGVTALLADLERFRSSPRIGELLAAAASMDPPSSDFDMWAKSLLDKVDPSRSATHDSEQREAAQDATTSIPGTWVLIVGTVAPSIRANMSSLDENTERLTAAIAALIADSGLGLITGRWPGVDVTAAESYAAARTARGSSVDDGLIRLVKQDDPSPVPGRTQKVGSDAEYVDKALARADIVVLIGGAEYTLVFGRLARKFGIPVIPIAVTGGAARTIFDELARGREYRREDTLATAGGASNLVEIIVDRVDERLRHYQKRPVALEMMAEAYLTVDDLGDADRIDARLIEKLTPEYRIGRQRPDEPDLSVDKIVRPVDQALDAFSTRVRPTPARVEALIKDFGRFLDDLTYAAPWPSTHKIVWQRLRAVEAGFAKSEVRESLPADTEDALRRTYNWFDDETRQGGFAGRVKVLLAQQLLPFARLIGVARAAEQSPDASLPEGLIVSSDAIGDALAKDLLEGQHAGWRLIGLARAMSDPSAALLPSILRAVNLNATRSHLRMFVRALAALIERTPSIPATGDQRRIIFGIAAGVRTDERAAYDAIVKWLETAATNDEMTPRWASLVEEYNDIRESETASDARTEHMTNVVTKMRNLATEDRAFDALTRLDDADRGWRLAAYAFIHEDREAHYFEPLCRSLLKYRTTRSIPDLQRGARRSSRNPPSSPATGNNRPFGDYWGLLALERVAANAGTLSDERVQLLTELENEIPRDAEVLVQNLRQMVRTDRWTVLQRILGRARPRA